jgi:YggT family protein
MVVIAAVRDVLLMILNIVWWTVLAWVILSWVILIASHTSFRWRYASAFHILNQIYDFFGRMARPFIRPFQRMLPSYKTGGIDWSPIMLFLAIYLLQAVVIWVFSLILRP